MPEIMIGNLSNKIERALRENNWRSVVKLIVALILRIVKGFDAYDWDATVKLLSFALKSSMQAGNNSNSYFPPYHS